MFTFECTNFAPDTFFVLRWSGEEKISQPYRIELTLLARDNAHDLMALLGAHGRFRIKLENGMSRHFHGTVREAFQLDNDAEWACYRVVLMPRLAGLADYRFSDVYLDQTLPEIVRRIMLLGELGIEGERGDKRYDFRICMSGPDIAATKTNFVCQFDENCLDFLTRRLARQGVYYYFEQLDDCEAVVFCGDRSYQTGDATPLAYRLASTRRGRHLDAAVERFSVEVRPVLSKVVLRDFAGSHAALDLHIDAPVDGGHYGERALYGEHFDTEEEGRRLARLRAQAAGCRAREYRGLSHVPMLSAGAKVRLADHPREDFNSGYQLIGLRHEGGQLVPGRQREQAVGVPNETDAVLEDYRNEFIALPEEVQFRPDLEIRSPIITQTVSAIIDAEGDEPYAHLNEYGCYKVRFPFQHTDKATLRSSAWLRLMSPYAGAQHGMHLPLLKGTEVIVAFLNGDPDRPYIAGAVANSENPNVVLEQNAKQNVLRTAGGNQFVLDDKRGNQRIHLATPVANTSIKLGQAKQPGLEMTSDAHIEMGSASSMRVVHGAYSEKIVGSPILPTSSSSSPPAQGNFGDSKSEAGKWFKASAEAGLIVRNHAVATLDVYEGLTTSITLGMATSMTYGQQNLVTVGTKIDIALQGVIEMKQAVTKKVFENKQETAAKTKQVSADKEEVGVKDKKKYVDSSLQAVTYKVDAQTLKLSGEKVDVSAPSVSIDGETIHLG
ncbi:type VI secretion system Vgr family protein [Pandoraea horticolens]|uniref:type VI secretion system Vgr family protein n=1 Tax=Pandoraea horticolens TaxID=2508298 RepID=UPI0015820441|nr:type VI secretion system Vgr family protein [Pandoraea horticolens]